MLSFRYDRSEHPRPMGHVQQLVTRQCAYDTMPAPELNGIKEQMGSVLSVVVPAHNEAASLVQLVDEITRALRPLCHCTRALDDFEIIVIDDGSTDSTRLLLAKLASVYPELRWLVLSSQVGQTAATVAGIRAARGDWIATLDADLQNDPADVARLWTALPGNDAVLGWRVKRKDFWTRRMVSYWSNWLRNIVLWQSIRDTGCSVRIFPRAVALRLPTFYGMHRFFGPLLGREGCRLAQVPVNHRPRSHGRSHYTLWNRSFQVLIDLVGVIWLMHRAVRFQVIATCDAMETKNHLTNDTKRLTRLPRFFARQS
jgi:glycosyltransferase involved in cell wall biosynthesis